MGYLSFFKSLSINRPKVIALLRLQLVVMGTSSASIPDTTINTSTDSACTLITNVTHTDTSETYDSLDLGKSTHPDLIAWLMSSRAALINQLINLARSFAGSLCFPFSGDNSGPSEPLFSSLEEPLLTAVHIDSEHEGFGGVGGMGGLGGVGGANGRGATELELTSCSRYPPRPDMNLQDSVEVRNGIKFRIKPAWPATASGTESCDYLLRIVLGSHWGVPETVLCSVLKPEIQLILRCCLKFHKYKSF